MKIINQDYEKMEELYELYEKKFILLPISF